MNDKLRNILLPLTPFIGFFVFLLLISKHYYDLSFESYKFCVKQIEESKLSTNVCSHILSESNSAYSSATLLFIPIVIVLCLMVFAFGAKLFSISEELKEIKEKLNV